MSVATPLISSRDLLRSHKDVCIVLCEAAYTHQSVKLTGFLMTVNQSQLSHAQRQITVRARLRLHKPERHPGSSSV